MESDLEEEAEFSLVVGLNIFRKIWQTLDILRFFGCSLQEKEKKNKKRLPNFVASNKKHLSVDGFDCKAAAVSLW